MILIRGKCQLETSFAFVPTLSTKVVLRHNDTSLRNFIFDTNLNY